MKLSYCEHCQKKCAYRVMSPIEEQLMVNGVVFRALQKHAYCDECGTEVYPMDVVDYCVTEGHDGYRKAVGSIPVKRIQELLDRYDIGKGPLSKLLGWSPNTIAREMKHCIPDKEHAAKLESLFDAQKMLRLLEDNKGSISPVAYRKVKYKLNCIMGAKSIHFERSYEISQFISDVMSSINSLYQVISVDSESSESQPFIIKTPVFTCRDISAMSITTPEKDTSFNIAA